MFWREKAEAACRRADDAETKLMLLRAAGAREIGEAKRKVAEAQQRFDADIAAQAAALHKLRQELGRSETTAPGRVTV